MCDPFITLCVRIVVIGLLEKYSELLELRGGKLWQSTARNLSIQS